MKVRILFCVAATSLVMVTQCFAIPIIGNAGFENATLAPWLPNSGTIAIQTGVVTPPTPGPAGEVNEGVQSVLITPSATFKGMKQVGIPLAPGDLLKTYTLSYDRKIPASAGAPFGDPTDDTATRIQIVERNAAGGIAGLHVSIWRHITESTFWVNHPYQFTLTSPNAVKMEVFFQSLKGAKPYLIDNIKLVPEPATLALLGFGFLATIRRKKRRA